MSEINLKIKKFILSHLYEDLRNKNIVCHEKEFWILDLKTTEWYVCIISEGSSWYNQDYFKKYINLFSIEPRQLSKILIEWIDEFFEIRINQISRRQSNMTYIIEGILKSKKKKWDLNNRYGFTYETVKRYVNLKKNNQELFVEDFVIY